MKFADLRGMSDDQLVATLAETQQNLFRLRMQSQTERLDSSTELRRHRRLIAQVLTLQNQRKAKA